MIVIGILITVGTVLLVAFIALCSVFGKRSRCSQVASLLGSINNITETCYNYYCKDVGMDVGLPC